MLELEKTDFGDKLQADLVEKGLRELNPDLNFDLGARTNQYHPQMDTRQGVFFREDHICSMDRGIIPEFKIWKTTKRIVELPWYAADREDASISYVSVPKSHPEYEDLLAKGHNEANPEYMVKTDGKLLKLQCMGYEPVKKTCLRVGWRHTFERILAKELPGVTRKAIEKKFGVDMGKFPVGTPEELVAALAEE
jgi:hypothetical protein